MLLMFWLSIVGVFQTPLPCPLRNLDRILVHTNSRSTMEVYTMTSIGGGLHDLSVDFDFDYSSLG